MKKNACQKACGSIVQTVAAAESIVRVPNRSQHRKANSERREPTHRRQQIRKTLPALLQVRQPAASTRNQTLRR